MTCAFNMYTYLVCGVPQRSVLGTILFVIYTVDLLMVTRKLRIITTHVRRYTHLYDSCRPSAVATFATKFSECVEATTSWMRSNRLQPNQEKTEVLWRATAHVTVTSVPVTNFPSTDRRLLCQSGKVCTRPWYLY